MANLTLAFTTDDIISMMLTSQTSEWPEGLACNVVKELMRKHKPDDVMSLVDEKVDLNKIRMTSNDENQKHYLTKFYIYPINFIRDFFKYITGRFIGKFLKIIL